MPWNIRVIHRSIKLTENVPPALGELNSAGFLRAKLREEKKNWKNTPHTINQPIGHLAMNEISLRRWGEREQSSIFFPPDACVDRLNTPLHRSLTSGQCPVQAGEQGPTSVFPVHLKIHCVSLLFPYSVSLNTPKGIAAARKTQPLISPRPYRNFLIHPAQNWNTQPIRCDLGLLQVGWPLWQGPRKDCNTTLHSSHLPNPCLIKHFTLPFPKQD